MSSKSVRSSKDKGSKTVVEKESNEKNNDKEHADKAEKEKPKDWSPLMNDFDRRLEAMERKQKGQEQTNTTVESKLGDHDDSIRKLLNEIKLLKIQRPKNDTPENDDDKNNENGINGDQLSELFDSLNQLGDDLRKEMNDKFATKKNLDSHKTATDVELGDIKKRLDALEKENARVA